MSPNNQHIRSLFGQNLRFLRDKKGLTQKELAEIMVLGTESFAAPPAAKKIGSYEEGRAFPQPHFMQNILDYFGLSYEDLVQKDLQNLSDSEWDFLQSQSQKGFQVLAVPVDHHGNERIAMVPQKAAAGYVKGFADREYIRELDSFHLPWLPTGASYRAFEITGDSMPPIASGSVVLGKFIERNEIKEGERYIIVTKEGIVFKRVYHPTHKHTQSALLLTSDNPIFPPFEVAVGEIEEVWQFYAYIAMCPDK